MTVPAGPHAAHRPPRGLLVDLDDTVLVYSALGAPTWRRICADHAPELGIETEALYRAIDVAQKDFWSDEERFRVGRQDLGASRRAVTALALDGLGLADAARSDAMGDRYNDEREGAMHPFDGALEALAALHAAGVHLAMMTNGAAERQRAKIDRFDLEPLFTTILIEGEMGFGKPDPRVYRRALADLDLPASDVWAVGDNLVWDVHGPQQEGIHGVWLDWQGTGVPPGSPVQPDRVVRSLAELAEVALG